GPSWSELVEPPSDPGRIVLIELRSDADDEHLPDRRLTHQASSGIIYTNEHLIAVGGYQGRIFLARDRMKVHRKPDVAAEAHPHRRGLVGERNDIPRGNRPWLELLRSDRTVDGDKRDQEGRASLQHSSSM